MHSMNPLFAISGLAVGLLVGMTGVGGGSLMTPLLILLFGVHPVTAVGTDLLYAAATKTVGSLVHGFNRNIDWRIVGRLALGSIPATGLTLFALSRFDLRSAGATGAITSVLGVALLATAGALIFRQRIAELYGDRLSRLSPASRAALTVATGVVLGALVSISSVGAGAIGATVLVLLNPRMPMARIVGSDIAHAVPLTLLAGIGHWMLGSIDAALLGSLLAGSIPGIALGSVIAGRVPDAVLRFALAVTLVVVGSELVL
ncbi:MAG TPA: sulfite exporter TauE/SafE family protein [Stellaceae bacterium]|nr:sulfite exporter TauE/SafE family protein [Stellaceae bacterium]